MLQTPEHHVIPLAVFLISRLKSAASIRGGEQLHALAAKSGLHLANSYVRNSLLSFYSSSRHHLPLAHHLLDEIPQHLLDTASHNTLLNAHLRFGHFSHAHQLFDQMPQRDTISYTTLITALARSGQNKEALTVFRAMVDECIAPNEVTIASVLPACARLDAGPTTMVHAFAVRRGLGAHVLVATNLVNSYATVKKLADARALFDRMADRNTVTWNVMLNGYLKAGMFDMAVEVFGRIPERDAVSWAMMIGGSLYVDQVEDALMGYVAMQHELGGRPNAALLVDMISGCARRSAVTEGQQLHAVIIKDGLDVHAFVQTTLIHFYGSCNLLNLACLQFELADKSHLPCWNALLTGLLKSNLVDEARQLFDRLPKKDVVSWSALIAQYVQSGHMKMALQLFWQMQETGVEPNEITLMSVLSALADSGTLEQGRWIHDYIIGKGIPFSDNLSAGLIDMYAKRGSIANAMQTFGYIKEVSSSVSPWNAIICSLAIHGHAHTSLSLFSQLQSTKIRPNSITFVGVLNACCHAGLVVEGKRYFESMKKEYNIDPTVKHYGCMVDLLGRAGFLEEAEQLIAMMPMQADVMIWGCMLAAARTHGNVAVGERAAKNLARLEPSHGASRVLLLNIYANAGRWSDVSVVREELESGRLERIRGSSGILQ